MPKIGFCFSGDGARGGIQAGIALALFKQGIKPDLTIGISSGSANAALYAYGGPEGNADVWRNCKNILSMFGFNWLFPWKSGVFNQKPMAKMVGSIIKNDPVCEAIVSRMHLGTGEIEYVSNYRSSRDDFEEAALASVAVPALIEHRNGWADAGSRELAPLNRCIEQGCDEVYVITGAPLVLTEQEIPTGFFSFVGLGYRAVNILLYELLKRDLKKLLEKSQMARLGMTEHRNVGIHLVEPNEYLYDSILFRKCKQGVEYGENPENFHIRDNKAILTRYY